MRSFFETIKIENAKVFHIEYHQRRYENTLKTLGCLKKESLLKWIDPPKEGLWRCKIIYNEETIKEVVYFPYKKRSIGSVKLIDADIEYPLKALDRSDIDTLFAKKGECDEILICKNGTLRDTSIANIALYDGNNWITPKNPLLRGTTRQRYLEEGKIAEKTITKEHLNSCTKIAFLNAMVDFDIMSIEKIDKDTIIVK